MTQLPLLETPAQPRLSDRQAFALEQIRRAGGGILEADLGALLHGRARKHDPQARCEYCAFDGLQILKRLPPPRRVRPRSRTARARGHPVLMPSGARSGTKPSRAEPWRGAGDGRIMVRISLKCGHGVPREQVPIAVHGGRRWFSCPECMQISEARS